MRRFQSASTRPFLISLLVLSCASSLLAQDVGGRTPNKNHLLQGSYSFVVHGVYLDEPYAASGVLTFDGSGKITDGSATFVLDSMVFPADLLVDQPNTYVVHLDGSGTLRVFFAATIGFGLKFAIAITDNGRRVYLNATGLRAPLTSEDIPGPTATGEASQQQ